jgi:phosphatidylserine decarboxylase
MDGVVLLLIIFLIFYLFWFYFQREPRINKKLTEDKIILSPAYGKIFKIAEKDDQIHIIIILNIFDIHTQYYPINGKVIDQVYDANGNFSLVYELFKSSLNEKVITTIQPKSNIGGNIIVQQIAGMFVRRIDTTLDRKGQEILSGEKLGRIKFGSRVDLIIPKDKLILNVKENQMVNGPQTIIGYYDV